MSRRGEGNAPMMGMKERTYALQINVSLEELVPHDHFYRHLDQKLDHTARARPGPANVYQRRTAFH
jgi:hypothetical protein